MTLIKPAAIDTPFVDHAKNVTGHEPKLPQPVYPTYEVAESILYACENSERDIYVGGGGRVMAAMKSVAPGAMDWLGRNVLMPQQLQDKPPHDPRGSLYAPHGDGRSQGHNPGYTRKLSAYGRAMRHTTPLGVALAAAAGLAAVAILTGGGERKS